MKQFLFTVIAILFFQPLFADIPAGYYDSATGSGYTLKTQLYNIIDGHTVRTYTNLWTDMQSTDKRADGYVWDMYSNCDFTFVTDQDDGSAASSECIYYNREHSFPKSWFNDASPMYTDLFHLYPTDKVVNGKRSNFPFGEVGSATWTSENGSKLGTSDYPGYSGTVFEPIDEYKGDFARSYFYMATRYENVITTWPGSDMLDGTNDHCYTDWALSLLIEWHNNDPVSQKELDRNDAVYAIQINRNPFIDHPEYVAQIWGGEVLNSPPSITDITNTPTNPTSSETVNITATITDSDGTISNAELHWGLSSESLTNTIPMSVSSGNTYSTESDIQIHADGTIVYYEVEATDDSSDVTTSSEYSYTVDDNPAITILSEDFTSCTLTGWTIYSSAGTEDWSCGSGYMDINAYDSDVACDDWFITSVIDLNSYENEILTFKTWTKYSDTYYPPVGLKYSTNYSGSGDPLSATWVDLSATWSAENSEAWTASGDIDLSSISGSEVYIAFHYTSSGAGGGTSTQWEVDDILINGDVSSNNSPSITDISNSPASPTEEENVTISATITDSDGTISAAEIKWGTTTGSYPNTVAMTNSGDVYLGTISAQTGGTIIYYVIEATDNDSESIRSTESSFSFTAIPNELPEITDISHSPTSPLETDDVTISANITDSDGTISAAEIKWGTAPGSYPNTVAMTNTGDIYSGTISAQAGGTTIYYVIEATDNDLGSSRSTENSFSFTAIPNELPEITDISHSPTSPLGTDDVTISAIITDSDGIISATKIKWGASPGNYSNTDTMTYSGSGNIYTGIILKQDGGTTVYYIIEATDDESGTTQSGENSFSFNETPLITGISNSPVSPVEGEDITVSSTITDSDGTITSADLKWGTVSGTYPNAVTMTNTSDVYSGVISAQAGGTTIYYVIEASDNDSESSRSTENSFSFSTVGNIFPEISNLSFTPLVPESTESVDVSGSITDSDGTISTAVIKWGTSTGNYDNNIILSADNNTYTGTIPSQPDKTHVYFVIYTVDNDGGSAQSTEHDYIVDNPNVLPQIANVNFSPIDPESTESVTVSATITDSDGTISVATIKWGTSTGTYDNDVTMTDDQGTYSGIIPFQSDGTHVYFIVYATDNEGGIVQSSEQDYVVDNPNVLPEISNITINPSVPESNENVSVSATIIDSDGSIVTATIKWGTTSGNYNNNVTMSVDNDVYSGTIPALSDGTHVYFIIYTVDNDGGTEQSSENDYLVDDPNIIPEISNINFNPTDPESTESVRVSATITDSDGTISTAKIKWGTTSGSYLNIVSMSNSGSSYTGDISAQANGTNVFFIVESEDNEGGLSLSTELNYTVEDPVNQAPEISDILIDPVTPTEDDNVTVSAIVSDSDGTIESVVLKWKRGAGTYTDVNMNLSGDRYYGQILKQETGETISFSIIARDNDGLEGSYTDGSYEISESIGVNDLLKNNLVIYPNPTKGIINIEIDGSDQINAIKIYNLIGEKRLEVSDLNAANYTVDLNIYPKGIYILQIDYSQNTVVRKIMLK